MEKDDSARREWKRMEKKKDGGESYHDPSTPQTRETKEKEGKDGGKNAEGREGTEWSQGKQHPVSRLMNDPPPSPNASRFSDGSPTPPPPSGPPDRRPLFPPSPLPPAAPRPLIYSSTPRECGKKIEKKGKKGENLP